MRNITIFETCDVCGKKFYGEPINIHGSYAYIKHTNFSNNIGVMFARTNNIPKEDRADAIMEEFFKDGNDSISKEDAIEFLKCFKHYKKCDDKELLEGVFSKIQSRIDTMN